MGSGFGGFTNEVRTITTKHAHVHQGTMFSISANDTALASGGTISVNILMGTRHVSIIGDFSGDKNIRGQLYEGPTMSNDGTIITPVNRNRDSTHLMQAEFWTAPTITDNGTLLSDTIAIAGKSSVGAASVELDWALKPSTRYLIMLTNLGSQAAVVQVSLFMHDELNEHKFR